MQYRAHAVLRCDDREQATARLRDQLRVMALAGGVVVDWPTLAVEGPLPAIGVADEGWCGWTATVSVQQPAPIEPVTIGRVGAAGIEPATARL